MSPKVGRPKQQLKISDAALCGDFLRVLISKEQTARLLSVCVRSIDNLIRTGELESVKVGVRRLIPLAAVFVIALRDRPARTDVDVRVNGAQHGARGTGR